MRIRLVIADDNAEFANRLIAHFNKVYADQLEIYLFSTRAAFEQFMEKNRADVLLMSESVDIDVKALPVAMAYAYFSDSPQVDTIRDVRTVCRYQKADLIYKEILSLYSDRKTSITSYKKNKGDTAMVYAFAPASGGVGSTTLAVALAQRHAAAGKRVLFLTLEQCASLATLMDADGQFTLSDVIYAIKSNKSNLKLRLESMVRVSESGVHFYASPQVGLDVLEMTGEDVRVLVSELVGLGSYDEIVVDIDNAINPRLYALIRLVDAFILVSDGGEISNAKCDMYCRALKIASEKNKLSFEQKARILYNKFSSKTARQLDTLDVPILGGFPRYETADSRIIVQELAKNPVFDSIS